MSAALTMAPGGTPPVPGQALVGFMSNEDWDALIGQVDALVARMESLPEGDVKSHVFELLDGIDAIHREALRRLVRLFKDGVLEQVVSDPAIHTLMELYDLLPPVAGPAPAMPESPPARSRFPTIPIRPLPAGPVGRARHPHWVPALARVSDLGAGSVRAVGAGGQSVLLARRGQRVFALDPACPVDGSPLAQASLDGYTLSCPNHPGCHFDVRTGQRLGGGPALACHPVRVDEQGRVLVGFDMDFEPDLPSF